MPSHNHNFTSNNGWANNAGGSLNSPTIGTQTQATNPFVTGSKGSNQPHNNIQPSISTHVIIKT